MGTGAYIGISPSLKEMMDRLGVDLGAGMAAGMNRLLGELEARAVKEAPVDTSNLVNSITSFVTDGGFGGTLKATAPYALFVHEGTGLFGPHGKEIVILPGDAKALSWPGAAHPVRKVVQKGQKPNRFFQRAVDNTDAQASFEKGVSDYLRRKGW